MLDLHSAGAGGALFGHAAAAASTFCQVAPAGINNYFDDRGSRAPIVLLLSYLGEKAQNITSHIVYVSEQCAIPRVHSGAFVACEAGSDW